MSNNPLADFMLAFEYIGHGHLSDKACCRLLAWLLSYGIYHDTIVFNKRLMADILCAKKRMNIDSSCIPNGDLLPLMNKAMSECKKACDEKLPKPVWVVKLEKRYGLTH